MNEREWGLFLDRTFSHSILGQEIGRQRVLSLSRAERWTSLITLPFCYLPIPRITKLYVCALFAERKQQGASGWMRCKGMRHRWERKRKGEI
jgi:hypothetical protein